MWRFLFPKYEELPFQTIYDSFSGVDHERLNVVYSFVEKQYFAEFERRKSIDSRARALISMLSIMLSLILMGNLVAGFKINEISTNFTITYIMFLIPIALASLAALFVQYKVPQQKNFFDPVVMRHEHQSVYIVYLIYEYYRCWIHNMTRDQRKARILQLAQILFLVAVVLFAYTGYCILLQFPLNADVKGSLR